MVSLTSYLHGYDLLSLTIQQPSMKSILLTIARSSAESKLQYVIPILSNVFTEEKLQQMLLSNIHIDDEILNLIRKAHAIKTCQSSSRIGFSQNHFDIILNIPVIPLEQLPSNLISLMRESMDNSAFSLKHFQDQLVIYIGKSLQNASQLCDCAQELQQIKEELNKYGWLNEFDGFTLNLTTEALEALFLAMGEIFTKKESSQPESPITTIDLLVTTIQTTQETLNIPGSSQSDVSEKDNRILYSYCDWLVDRPLSIVTQSVQRLIDILRHRLDIESVLPSTFCEMAGSNSWSTAKKWLDRRSSVILASSTSIAGVSIDSTRSSFKTIYDILIHLLNHSDLLGQIELFRLLMERRVALPLLTPTNYTLCLYKYHINPLTFMATKISGQRELNLSVDTSLYRIAIISMRPVKEQESIQWMQYVFSCQSLSSSSVECIPLDRCIAEIGIGFVPFQADGSEISNCNLKNEEVLVLNVIGDYSSIWPFITDFADLLMVEELPLENSSFYPPNALPDHVNVITWKASNIMSEPAVNENDYYHISGSILQSVKHIHVAIISIFNNDCSREYQKRYPCLNQMSYRQLYVKPSIKVSDIESTVRGQNFSKLRSDELKLQQQYVAEAEYSRKQREDKSSVATQETLRRAINDCRQKRTELASSIEQHPLIQFFVRILSHRLAYQRALNIVEFTQKIDIYSRKALQDIIERKNQAFHNYNPNSPNSAATQAYLEARHSYVDNIVGLEHLWREMSHLYTTNPRRFAEYPGLAAKHLIDGFTLEILDGDAAMLNQTWIKAVFLELEQQLKHSMKDSNESNIDIRVFVLSILGEQSSGKSTLLNWMYGIRLRASAGMTTKGVHIQLLKAENRREYHYVLVLDTEGINAPEYKGLTDAAARDNRLATFAILPADATIILINNEADQVARDVLSIVMLAYQQSEFAIQTAGGLNSKIFFVYTRVDVNDVAKLNDKIELMFIELKNNAASIQQSNQQKIGTNVLMFRDFRMKGPDGSNTSDIKFLGKINYANIPPKDTPDPTYGQSVIELKEYIYKRVVGINEDGSQWKAKSLSTFASYLDFAWQCIVTTDFTLTFKNLMDRRSYDNLQVYLATLRAKLAIHYSSKYDEIETKLLIDLRQYQAKSEDVDNETCQKLIRQYQEEFTASVQEDAVTTHYTVLKDLKEKDEVIFRHL
jgi:hypothetical protein